MSYKLRNPRTNEEIETPSEDRRDFMLQHGWELVDRIVSYLKIVKDEPEFQDDRALLPKPGKGIDNA
jgi:hypothetical protein